MSIVSNRGNGQNISYTPLSRVGLHEQSYQQQNILITNSDFKNYLTKMAELVNEYRGY